MAPPNCTVVGWIPTPAVKIYDYFVLRNYPATPDATTGEG